MSNVGSIFSVDLGENCVRYFWCVGKDSSQLNSALIVVFRRTYQTSDQPAVGSIVADEIDFYCHVFLLAGKKQGLWRKHGFLRFDGSFPMLFKGSEDYGNSSIRVSERWYIWEPNTPYRTVARRSLDLEIAELGMVFPPDCVVERIRTGKYGIFHPTHDSAVEPCA
jgi:hypothetical protein